MYVLRSTRLLRANAQVTATWGYKIGESISGVVGRYANDDPQGTPGFGRVSGVGLAICRRV